MAVHREPYNCPHCGEPYEAVYSQDIEKEPNYSKIIGDNFVRWDTENHKCKPAKDKTEPKAKEGESLDNLWIGLFDYYNEFSEFVSEKERVDFMKLHYNLTKK